MKLSNFLSGGGALFAFGLTILLPLAVAMLKLGKFGVTWYSHYQRVKRAQKLAAMKRPGQGQQPNFVRHDDVVRLTPEQIKLRTLADDLVKEGKALEAAQIYRQLTLDRSAIQALEDAGLIKEACLVLLDKKLPNRAGLLCDRNGYYLEAADFFKMAKMPLEAGNAYVKAAAAQDYRYYRNAAATFEEGNFLKEAIDAYENLLEFDQAIALCQKLKSAARLLALSLNPLFPASTLKEWPVEQRQQLLHDFALTPKVAQDLGYLAARDPSIFDFRSLIQKLKADKTLVSHFMDGAGYAALGRWIQHLQVHTEPWEARAWHCLAEALRERGQFANAAMTFEKIGDLSSALRCCLAMGDRNQIKLILEKSGKLQALESFQSIMDRYREAVRSGDAQTAAAGFWKAANECIQACHFPSAKVQA